MSLHPQPLCPVPEETVRVARAAFPQSTASLRLRDAFGPLFSDPAFAALFPLQGQPAEAPWRLALVTVLQFAEGLADRQAADAVRSRIDWKYLLGLELTDPGFDASVLSEFRTRLIAGGAEEMLLDALLEQGRAHGLLKARGRQRTDSSHVLAAIRVLNRLECVGETVRHALNALAVVAPDWLRAWVPPAWFDRYDRPFSEYQLPAGRAEREALAARIGADGFALLAAAYDDPGAPSWVRHVPAVQTLRQVWVQQFYAPAETVRWRSADDLPPATRLIRSPYDPEARYGKKRDTEWTGYKVHLTETCDDDGPHLLTNVETTAAPVADVDMLPPIQNHLAARELLPREHLVDSGYVAADHLVTSQTEHGLVLLGPVPDDHSWQALANEGFATSSFVIDWAARQVTCPQGHTSTQWLERRDRLQHPVIQVRVRFAPATCLACPVRAHCTQSTGPRTLMCRTQTHFEALQEARQRQKTEAFKRRYAARAGVEGTIAQGVQVGDLRRARYIGVAKTHLQHVATAAGLNLLRVSAWLADVPRAQTYRSPFTRLKVA